MEQTLRVTGAQLFQRLDRIIDDRFADLVRCRRHLHMFPERSWEEIETTKFIIEQLREMGIEPKPGARSCGCTVDLAFGGHSDRGTIAVRGDIDAIPVTEANRVDYCSRVSNLMHACGHDVHAVVLLGVCAAVQELGQQNQIDFPFSLRALFQPAEEVAEGASAMIETGVLDGVTNILSLHVDPHRSVGHIGLRTGVQTARCDDVQVTVTAGGGHAARPHETSDPVFAAAQFINAVYSHLPRSSDSRYAGVLTFCHVQGGDSSNVIPTTVALRGTMRSLDETTRMTMMEQIKNLASSIGLAFGSEIDVKFGVSVPSVRNDAKMIDLFRTAAETFLDRSSIDEVSASMGGEDFAFYLEKVDGALVRVGCANPHLGFHPLHSPHFDADEETIRVACKLLVRSVLLWNNPDLLQAPAA